MFPHIFHFSAYVYANFSISVLHLLFYNIAIDNFTNNLVWHASNISNFQRSTWGWISRISIVLWDKFCSYSIQNAVWSVYVFLLEGSKTRKPDKVMQLAEAEKPNLCLSATLRREEVHNLRPLIRTALISLVKSVLMKENCFHNPTICEPMHFVFNSWKNPNTKLFPVTAEKGYCLVSWSHDQHLTNASGVPPYISAVTHHRALSSSLKY